MPAGITDPGYKKSRDLATMGESTIARQSARHSAPRPSTTDRPKPRRRVHFQTRNRAAPDRPHNRLSRQRAAASDIDFEPAHQPAPNRVPSPKPPAPVPPKPVGRIPR